MENNNFDRRMRERLQGLEGKYQAGDWEKMEQRLDAEFVAAPEMDDVLLDGMAYGSLKDLHVEYNPTHWGLMERKMDGTADLRKKLYRYKVIELTLIVLAIFTVLQFIPSENRNGTTSKEIVAAETPIDNRTSELSMNLSEATANDTDAKEETNPVEVQPSGNSSGGSFTSENPEKSIVTENTLTSATGAKENTNNNIGTAPQATDGHINITEILFEDRVAALTEKDDLDVFESQTELPKLSLTNRFFATTSNTTSVFASISPIPLFAPDEVNPLGQRDLPDCILCTPGKSPIRISIGMAVGPDADYVMTPYDMKYQKEEFGQLALGYSGGFSLGFKYNKWELETGAIYASTSYGSRNILEISGSFAQGGYVQQGLTGAQLDIVRVPLNLRYNFLDKKKWNYYLVTGGSVNMAVETLYEYTAETVGGGRFNAANSRSVESQDASLYDGIFEGGNFFDNTFLTANLGLGIERYFSPRMSVFFQPTYSHQLSKGLGPQKDKINSLSLMTGARVTLKKKNKK